jgi:bifunctional UDP-N-acetylglucosamine pyrophosphorylase/glucosamine-1-phosphate N-acetyltransferase
MKVCAVIPAAGMGSRLGINIPKLLLPVSDNETVWTHLRKKLLTVVDHIHIIASTQGAELISAAVAADAAAGQVSVGIQPKPIGMGDAIFRGFPVWKQAQSILVIWGDQIFVSQQTLAHTLAVHSAAENTLTLPLTQVSSPYVEYIFDKNKSLLKVKQSREGDNCDPQGLADVGTFVLSVNGLMPAWQTFLTITAHGSQTGEINFLPFLPFLSANGWQVNTLMVADNLEARGINTPDDLLFFQKLFNTEGTT